MGSDDVRTFVRLSYTGGHQGEIFGIQPTVRAFEYAGAAVFAFEKHRIAKVWVLGDIHGPSSKFTDEPSAVGHSPRIADRRKILDND